MNSITNLTISLTYSKDAKGNDIDQPICPPAHIELEVSRRTPARYHRAYVPAAQWPNLDDVPSIYKPLVQAALVASAESIMKARLDNATLDASFLPLSTITLEALLSTSAATGKMTADQLLGMWRGTAKYVLQVAPQFTVLTGSKLLAYKAKIEKFETQIKSLVSPKPETKLSAAALDRIMATLHTDDESGAYAAFIAAKTEEIRAKLIEDEDAI